MYKIPSCSANFELSIYHECGSGETCESLRGEMDIYGSNVRLISHRCVCPKGFYITNAICV